MANITEVSQWENVIRQLENGEAATGGADGLANIQAKQLANRTQWLKDNYLKRSGAQFTDDQLIQILAGTSYENGTTLSLNTVKNIENSSQKYDFSIATGQNSDTATRKHFTGFSDGRLLWNDNDVAGSAIVAKSLDANGYIKYASGLIVQWGKLDFSATSKWQAFPITYTQIPIVISSLAGAGAEIIISCDCLSPTGFTCYANKITAGGTNHVRWLAIGY